MSELPVVHHIWCNGQRGPVKGCRWCDPDGTNTKGLWALYGYESVEEMCGLMAKHFPRNVEIPGTGMSQEEKEAHAAMLPPKPV